MRSQITIVLGAVVVGLAAGTALDPGGAAERVVLPALIALLTITFAGVRSTQWSTSIRPHRRIVVASVALNFAVTPVVAFVLGATFLGDQPDLRIGLVMLLVTPCTDWYLVFTRRARGNVPLAAALLPINLAAQLALLPVYVSVLASVDASVPSGDLVAGVLLVVGVPAVVVGVARVVAARSGRTATLDRLTGRLQLLTGPLLGIAIVALVAAHSSAVADQGAAVTRVVVPVAVFLAVAYVLATVTARWLRTGEPERAALTMATMARNSPLALAVAAAAFPDRPLVAVALVVGPLLELPVLTITAAGLDRGRHHRRDDARARPGPTR